MKTSDIFRLMRVGNVANKDGDFSKDNFAHTFAHKIHPKQVVNKVGDIPITFYEVEYEYTTVRGNRRTGVKYFMYNTFSPEVNMERSLKEWVENFNEEYPERKLLNVKFLKSKCLGYVVI